MGIRAAGSSVPSHLSGVQGNSAPYCEYLAQLEMMSIELSIPINLLKIAKSHKRHLHNHNQIMGN